MEPETVESHRKILRGIRASREAYARRMGPGVTTFSYSFALLWAGWGGMKIITENDSIGLDIGVVPGVRPRSGLTVEMVRALSTDPVYLMGSTPALVEKPGPAETPDTLVDKLDFTIMAYPHNAWPRIYFPVVATLYFEDLEYLPLYACTVRRPEGWPM